MSAQPDVEKIVYEVDDFRIKEFLGRCYARTFRQQVYQSAHERRQGDRIVSIDIGRSPDAFCGLVIDRKFYDLIEWFEVRVNGDRIRMEATTRAQLIGAWIHGGSQFLMPILVSQGPGAHYIELRFRMDPVSTHTVLELKALYQEPWPVVVKRRPLSRSEWVIAFCSGGLFTMGIVSFFL